MHSIMRLKTWVFLIAFAFPALVSLLFYVYSHASSIECKTVAIYSVDNIARSELDGLRFNIGRLIIGDGNIREAIQKNSLLLNADDKTMSLVSQVRIANPNVSFDQKFVEMRFGQNLDEISNTYGFAILNKSIECIAPPVWYQFLLPIVLLLLIAVLHIKNRVGSV